MNLRENLRFLDISFNANALCSKILSEFKKLTVLDISYMGISREELNEFVEKSLKKIKSLGLLNICGNGLSKTDLSDLKKSLPRVKCLTVTKVI